MTTTTATHYPTGRTVTYHGAAAIPDTPHVTVVDGHCTCGDTPIVLGYFYCITCLLVDD